MAPEALPPARSNSIGIITESHAEFSSPSFLRTNGRERAMKWWAQLTRANGPVDFALDMPVRLEREGVAFAYPTRNVYLEQEPAAEPA
jgi:hypothetical protein